MKILLTLFVLFFSSSVVAGDDLSGKSIICGEIDDNKKIQVFGVGFLKNYKVKMIVETVDESETLDSDNSSERENLYYETSHSLIKILIKNKSNFIHINRTSLNVIFYNELKETTLEISGENCLVYNEETVDINFKKIKQKLITEITKDNKL